MERLRDSPIDWPPGLQTLFFSSSSVLPKLPRDQADDATSDDEQEVVHPQERLQLGQHERQEGGEEEQAGEPGETEEEQAGEPGETEEEEAREPGEAAVPTVLPASQ